MIVAAAEGEFFRFEVEEAYDGYCVTLRDLETGATDDATGVVFRTAAVALAYAQMVAVSERAAVLDATAIGENGMSELLYERDRLSRHFKALSGRLADEGADLELLRANMAAGGRLWKRRYH